MTRDEIEQLERRLRETEVPDAVAARERARGTVAAAAHSSIRPRRRVRASLVWVAIAAVVAAVVVTQRDSRPAQAIERFVRDVVEKPKTARAPSVTALPGRGRLLVSEGGTLWVLERGGRRHALGAWEDATWSPRGLFVGVTAGHTLAALEPADGKVRWRLRLSDPVSDPRWAPDGLHIAYRAGSTLRIVYGNGVHDVLAGKRMAAVAPAWRSGAGHTVAWAATNGTVTVEDADTAKELFKLTGGPVRTLAWSADGRRLLVAGRRHGTIYTLATGARERLTLHPGEELVAAAFAPQGTRLALAVTHAGQTQVRLQDQPVLKNPGHLRDLEWSPDGRWLLAGWPTADHFLLVRTATDGAVTAVRHRFGNAARTHGWCC